MKQTKDPIRSEGLDSLVAIEVGSIVAEKARSTRSAQFEAPYGTVEKLLAAIWSELLGVEEIGRFDNFLELGGNSLLSVLMAERIRQMGFKADLPILALPVLCELASAIENSSCVDRLNVI